MLIDLKQMLEAGVHFGHRTSRWSPKMKPFIWGAKNKIHLIDVSKTALLLERAGKFIKDITSTGGKVLFVGTKKAAQEIVQKTATNTGMPFVINRWVGGTLSNYDQVKKAVTRLLHMRDILQKNTSHYKKKELSMIQKEMARLEKNVGGIINFDYPPAALIVVDAKKEVSAIKEAMRMRIPVIALIDTNTDPIGVSHIIPGNDDSPKAISFIMQHIESYVKAGVEAFEAAKPAKVVRPAAPAPKVEEAVAPVAPVAVEAAQPEAAAVVEKAEKPAKAAARPATRKVAKKSE
jgi:small subunit ribosomal protein S2